MNRPSRHHLVSRAALAGILCLVLAACAPYKREPLPNGVLPIAGTLPVELHLGQQEIVIESQQTNAMAAGGGILGALIVAAIDQAAAKKDEERAAAIRDLLVGSEIDNWMLDTVRQNIDPRPLGGELAYEVYRESPRARLSSGEMASRRQVLVVDMEYSLTYDFRALRIRLDTRFGDRVVQKKHDRSKYQYQQTFEYLVPVPGDRQGIKEDERAALWANLDRETFVALIQTGIVEVVEMMNWTFATAENPPQPKEKGNYRLGANAVGIGAVERRNGDRQWLRITPQMMVSAPK
jgi:hypothetical protein